MGMKVEADDKVWAYLSGAIKCSEECCDWCGSGPPLFEHVFLDGTRRLCSRCASDAIEEEDRFNP